MEITYFKAIKENKISYGRDAFYIVLANNLRILTANIKMD